MTTLDAEDEKLVTLARSTRARTGGPEGAAVRDVMGRTYAGSAVVLPSLRLSALQVVVAMAVSSGATGLEAAALVTSAERPDPAGLAAVRDLGGSGTPVLLVAPDGSVSARLAAE